MNRIIKIISSTLMTFGLVFFVGCEDDEVVETVYDSFDIQNVMSLTAGEDANAEIVRTCLLYTSPSPRDQRGSRMPSSA